MNSKKKQTVAVAMATALGVSAMMTPVAVYAQEEEPVITQEQVEESQIRQNASPQSVPVNNGTSSVSDNIDINETNFPDEKFRDWITDNVTGADNGVLTPDEISQITSIRISDKREITSLKGIEYFTALTTLNCQRTGITTLDVSNNGLLEQLYCFNTGIEELDVRNNEQLTRLDCSNTGIEELDVRNNEKLEHLYCSNTEIKTLDVSNNEKLINLYCNNTGITSLDVSKHTNLRNLYCVSTGITSLDVSNNEKLTDLYCSNTGITSLDVSKHTNLRNLYCSNTGIKTLDVSKNTKLSGLDCSNTPLAFLKLESLNVDVPSFSIPSSTTAELTVTSSSFDMTQAFAGVDTSKISDLKGAQLDGNIVTGYTVGTPITYTYDCGTNMGTPVTLDVELNLSKAASTIAFAGSLDRTYTGQPIKTPTVSKTGSTGTVTFTYQMKNGSNWEDNKDIPTNAGTYSVQAHLAGDDFNEGAVSEYTEFTIAKAKNSWTSHPALTGWTYGQQPNKPSASAMFGDVSYSYSDTEYGTFTSNVPTNAGTWYVKAIVEGTANYNVLDNTFPFTIAPKSVEGNSDITITDVNSDKDVEHLVVKDSGNNLVKGTDYDMEKKTKDSTTTVTITFKGNYEGTIIKTYTVEAVKPENKPQEKPQKKQKESGSVKTGDSTAVGLFAALSAVSVGYIVAGKKRKKNRNEN